MARSELSQEQLIAKLTYNPETGEFHHRGNRFRPDLAGHLAGSADHLGRVFIRLGVKNYQAHQLAWLYMTGEFGHPVVDHKDGDPSNNRWGNLRLATKSNNSGNARLSAANSTGFKGVSWNKQSRRYTSQVMCGGRSYFLGRFNTAEEAHAAYVAKSRELFGEYARPS